MNNPLRDLIYFAKCNNIEINEITVSPSYYEILEAEAIYIGIYDTKGSTVLRFYDVIINKRLCKGCCSHDAKSYSSIPQEDHDKQEIKED